MSAGPAGAATTIARPRFLWMVAAAIALHNAEEAMTFATYLPRVRAQLPEVVRPIVERVQAGDLRAALVWATVLPLVVVAWAVSRPASVAARWCALLLVTVLSLNVVSHVLVAGLVLHGYSPGRLTALVAVAPVAVYTLRRAARERWIPTRSWWLLPPAALLVHGPGLIGLLLLA